ncbi:MAG: GNAT family N-acetyltransferase [Clostridiales bacterium]|nr:GNAT family N-acetyltransferase [Clostridiales bacterium]
MIIRKIKPEEVKRTEELFSVSFDSSYNNEETPIQLYNRYVDNPTSREEEHCLERFAAFEDDDQTMMSCFIVQPFDIHFDGHTSKMVGIGGVATLPQYRKRGGIRACFSSALPYMYEQGVAFSYLYPFSTAYYRKFGYELCYKRYFYSVALPYIPVYPISGSCYLLEQATMTDARQDIPYIYRKWLQKYNMMVADTDYDYRFIESANPFKDQVFTYVYRSERGEALAYMTFKCDTSSERRTLECSRFFYINKEGLQGLLTLAKSFAADYRYVRFSLPADMPLEQVLPEWSMGAVSCEIRPNGMVRVIDVKKVLEDARYIGDGRIAIEIQDPFISQNNNIFSVTFQNGKCTELTCIKEKPDISLPISAFSALITGGYDTDAIPLWENVSVYGDMEMVSKVFYRKKVFITTYF